MQPFWQNLFTQGPPAGPQLLMRKMKGEITTDEAAEEWKQQCAVSDRLKKTPTDPLKMLYRCTQCFLRRSQDYMKPATAFGAYSLNEIRSQIISHGWWTRCLACIEYAATKNEITAMHKVMNNDVIAALPYASTPKSTSK